MFVASQVERFKNFEIKRLLISNKWCGSCTVCIEAFKKKIKAFEEDFEHSHGYRVSKLSNIVHDCCYWLLYLSAAIT